CTRAYSNYPHYYAMDYW
nr:immunoglobulin heavy chain junction region [Mus musculus]